ncbi:Zinc finger protein 862 [Merluccius polli]|uniref:Zinc finger protein 862 n=1 Tax=Merluccius polli TaxID=89951 RepID=A0AA47P2E7_MERPO|nr:Zinc finger protein 862 [Merluccius polli]KAK0145179.1 Zinc finger protein 862 [Merluccius polli]KAK0148021.1 Zinc finger protein 862 [Merluccius polli]
MHESESSPSHSVLESKSSHESLNLAHESDSSPSPGLEYYNTGYDMPIASNSADQGFSGEIVGQENSRQNAAVTQAAIAEGTEETSSKINKHRRSGFNPEWLSMPQYTGWLYHTQHGMFCRLCRQHKPANKKGTNKRPFVEVAAETYRKDYIDRHIKTDHHQESIRCQASLSSGVSVIDSFEPTIVLEHEAIIGGFKCLYWLVKNEIAHHTNYPKLLTLAELLGCDYFEKLKIDQRNNYRSHRIIDEMLEILAEVLEEPILNKIRSSRALSLEIDESTDVSVSKQLDIHIRYLDKEGHVFNQFLDLVSVNDGKANTIVTAVKEVLLKKGIPTEKLYGLGTDGAAVMTGRVNGVAKQLKESFPKLVAVACAAHKLALACKDASNSVKYMATFRDHLQDLYLFFHNSANRTATLKAASTTLGLTDLKVKEVKDTRWLSQHKAIVMLQKNLAAVLGALAEEAEIRKCPTAKGLYTFCATYRFVASVYLQADVLPHLACLSKVFQKAHVNFVHIKEQVPVTIQTLRDIRDAGLTPIPRSFLSHFHTDLEDPDKLGAFDIKYEEERGRRGEAVQDHSRVAQWGRFQQQVIQPYITGLETELERRFQEMDILGAFHFLRPQSAALPDYTMEVSQLQILAKRFCPDQEKVLLQEWFSFKNHVLTGPFQNKSQEELLRLLASEYDEWADLYPCLSLLASIALIVPVSSVNCERDFSAMNRIKTDLRNRLQGEHLAACLRISINGPLPKEVPYDRALEIFFSKPRKIRCSDRACKLCTN